MRKYHNHKLQANPWHREEEQHNNHETHEEKLTKASSPFLPNKMIAKPEWTQSNAQQNTEQLQNPTTGAAHFSLFVATSVKRMVVWSININKSSLRKNFSALKSNIFEDIIDISRVLTVNVKIMFDTNEKVQKINISYNKIALIAW